jgi:hypothetical protein
MRSANAGGGDVDGEAPAGEPSLAHRAARQAPAGEPSLAHRAARQVPASAFRVFVSACGLGLAVKLGLSAYG